jgi:TetR/AcrR family transcriptional regulator, transcriptional repressor of bet genes
VDNQIFFKGSEMVLNCKSEMLPEDEGISTTRAEQKLITRQKLLDATIKIIADEGMLGVTLAKVAEQTGLSRGICNFHFRTKDQLMLEAFRMLYKEHEQAWRDALADIQQSPAARLTNLVHTLLSPPIADHEKVAVWLAYWGETPHRQTYLELCSASDRLYENAIEELLRQMSGGREKINGMSLMAIAVALTAMIDGITLQYLIAPDMLSVDEANRACLAYLSSFFPEFRQG